MKRLLHPLLSVFCVAALVFAGLGRPAWAGSDQIQAVQVATCASGTPVTQNNFTYLTVGPHGELCISGSGGGGGGATAPYVLTSTGFQKVASFSASTTFTPPATSTVCFIQAEGNPVRFRTDGTAPTATVGQLLAVGAVLQETASLSTIAFIPTTGSATLDVDCYK